MQNKQTILCIRTESETVEKAQFARYLCHIKKKTLKTIENIGCINIDIKLST